jgi:molecular chaperone HscB
MTGQYSKRSDGFRCDECGQDMAVPLFCDHCGTNYPERRAMGPFSVLGLVERWDLDQDALEAKELVLAQRLHPDKWQGRGERKHKHALLAWAAVNGALKAVTDPFVRATTLINGTDEHTDGQLGDGKRDVPQDFLIEQLELQEELESPVDSARRKDLNKQIRRALKELTRQLAGHFEIVDASEHAGEAAGDARIAALQGARAVVSQSRYWRNAQQALRAQSAR